MTHYSTSSPTLPAHLPRPAQPRYPAQPPYRAQPPHRAQPSTWASRQPAAPTFPAHRPPGPPLEPLTPPARKSRRRGPRLIALIIVAVVALAGAGLVGAELYVRKAAVDKIRAAVACEIGDSKDAVSVSISSSPPVLLQYLNDDYTKLTVITDGTHIRSAQGITAEIVVEDIDLSGDANKKGTIGAVNTTIAWTTEGMRESLNDALKEAINEYLEGSFFRFLQDWIDTDQVVTSIETDPAAGTITLNGIFDSTITVKPETTADGGIRLVVQPDSFTLGGGLDLPQEDLQEKLDEMTAKLTDNEYNVHVDSLEVVNDGVVGKLSATDVDIPKGDGGEGSGCEGL